MSAYNRVHIAVRDFPATDKITLWKTEDEI